MGASLGRRAAHEVHLNGLQHAAWWMVQPQQVRAAHTLQRNRISSDILGPEAFFLAVEIKANRDLFHSGPEEDARPEYYL